MHNYITYRKASAFIMLIVLYQSITKGEDEFYKQRTETARLLRLHGLYWLVCDDTLDFTIDTVDFHRADKQIFELVKLLLIKQ